MIRHKSIVSFTKTTSLGEPFTVYREIPEMPRIDDRFLDCSAYLYPTMDAATKGERAGGSGFLVGMWAIGDQWLLDEPCPVNNYFHLYVVSNRHLIRQDRDDFTSSPVIRLNTSSGDTAVVPATAEDWTCSEKHDIAAIPIRHSQFYHYLGVSTEVFLPKDRAALFDIRIGYEDIMDD